LKQIIFRADGNSLTGLGHLYRLFALAEFYRESFDIIFVCRADSQIDVIPKTYKSILIPLQVTIGNEPQWLRETFDVKQSIIIADGYHFNAEYQSIIKEKGFKLIYIDDLVSGHQYADVVVNHSLGIDATDYKGEPYSKYALGPAYAMLRPSFIEAVEKQRKIHSFDTVIVCFGGADPLNLSMAAVSALLNCPEFSKINVVLGAAYANKAIFALYKSHPKVQIFQNLSESELVQLMQSSNFGIAPSSNILYELCAVKMPLLTGHYAENQMRLYKGCIESGIAYGAGDISKFESRDFEVLIKRMLFEGNLSKYVDAQIKMFDNKIKERFLNLIDSINYRRAGGEDMMLLYEWANDRITRENSYNSEPILLETHKVWFERKLKETGSCIFIVEMDNQPAGMVRYDAQGENAVISIIVAEDFRGKGLAAEFLKGTSSLKDTQCYANIFAYVKKQNNASAKAFEKAGYNKLREEIVNGVESIVYVLKRN
jgi:UDP-2,4-diacetamido-2,4,6-trideoxy-beta-L-altropyranose hydrolase